MATPFGDITNTTNRVQQNSQSYSASAIYEGIAKLPVDTKLTVEQQELLSKLFVAMTEQFCIPDAKQVDLKVLHDHIIKLMSNNPAFAQTATKKFNICFKSLASQLEAVSKPGKETNKQLVKKINSQNTKNEAQKVKIASLAERLVVAEQEKLSAIEERNRVLKAMDAQTRGDISIVSSPVTLAKKLTAEQTIKELRDNKIKLEKELAENLSALKAASGELEKVPKEVMNLTALLHSVADQNSLLRSTMDEIEKGCENHIEKDKVEEVLLDAKASILYLTSKVEELEKACKEHDDKKDLENEILDLKARNEYLTSTNTTVALTLDIRAEEPVKKEHTYGYVKPIAVATGTLAFVSLLVYLFGGRTKSEA